MAHLSHINIVVNNGLVVSHAFVQKLKVCFLFICRSRKIAPLISHFVIFLLFYKGGLKISDHDPVICQRLKLNHLST